MEKVPGAEDRSIRPPTASKTIPGCFRILLRLMLAGMMAFLIHSLLAVILYAFVPPPVTPLMVIRAMEQRSAGNPAQVNKKWVPLEMISQHLIDAVVASEDNRFLTHWGIDRQAIRDAIEYNRRSNRTRGASTITQQVAKTLYLWPSRTWIRKGFELYFTALIELFWSKKRIMEVYLNIIETGDGVYGAEAAAQKYFHKSARQLTREEAAMMAISLPNPRQRNPASPTEYMRSRQNNILNLMRKIGTVNLE